jgi:SAM-dependent methyltransferase
MTSNGTSIADGAETGAVWERVWQHRPTDAKDDARLRDEQQGTRWAIVSRFLRDTLGAMDGLRTIELGAGRGDWSVLLASAGASVTLVDRSAAVLTQARERFDRLGLNGRFVQADLFDATATEGNEFDVALSLGVIEHFRGPDRLRTVQAHAGAVRPGGVVLIGVPHAGCPPYRLWKAYLELRGWWPYGMEIPYSKRELARLAAQTRLGDGRLVCTGFKQSLGAHLAKTFLGRQPAWTHASSRLDGWLGLNLTLIARKPIARKMDPVGGAV